MVEFSVIPARSDEPIQVRECERDQILETLQAAVGGYVEIAGTTYDGHHIVVNEDGLAMGLAHNEFGSSFASSVLDRKLELVGPVAVVKVEDFS